MRFKKLDLNLLVALDALLTERSITRAGQRLSLTPSAMSSALARLRVHFKDELLVQVGRKMEPTPRAEGLHDAVRDVLLRIESTIDTHPQFNPAASDRTFSILMSDYTQMVLLPHLMALATQARCTARFQLLPQVTDPQRALERSDADLLIIPSGFASPEHPQEVLYEEDFVCVVWRDGELGRGELTMERYLAAGHVVMQPSVPIGESFEASFVKRYGVERRVAISTYGFAPLPVLVCGTGYVATVHVRLAQALTAAWPLELKTSPLPIDKMAQCVQWHKYRTHDPGLVWLRDLLRQAVLRMDATQPGASYTAGPPAAALDTT